MLFFFLVIFWAAVIDVLLGLVIILESLWLCIFLNQHSFISDLALGPYMRKMSGYFETQT